MLLRSVMARSPAVLGVFLIACGSDPHVRPAAPASTPTSSVKSVEPAAKRTTIDAEALPLFARPQVSIEIEYPDRVRLQRTGRLSVEWPSAAGEDDKSPERKVDWEPPLVEQGSDAKPYRILCRDADAQLAVYVAAQQLATVALEPLVLHPKANPPETIAEKDPGVRVAKGASLTIIGARDAVDQVRFESVGLTGEGFARRTKVGRVFRPDDPNRETPAPLRYQAELARADGAIFSAPDPARRPIATLSPYPPGEGSHFFQQLGPDQNGHVLVRLLHPETTVVGWIDRSALKPLSGGVVFGKEFNKSTSRLTGSRMMPTKKGAVLLSLEKKQPIGVMLADHDVPCVKRCESDEPIVAVRACGGVARAIVAR